MSTVSLRFEHRTRNKPRHCLLLYTTPRDVSSVIAFRERRETASHASGICMSSDAFHVDNLTSPHLCHSVEDLDRALLNVTRHVTVRGIDIPAKRSQSNDIHIHYFPSMYHSLHFLHTPRAPPDKTATTSHLPSYIQPSTIVTIQPVTQSSMPPAHCLTVLQCLYGPTLILLVLVVFTIALALLLYAFECIRDAHQPPSRLSHPDHKELSHVSSEDDNSQRETWLCDQSEKLGKIRTSIIVTPV